MPWAFDLETLKRNSILWLQRRAEERLERLRSMRERDRASLDQLRETASRRRLSLAKLEAYYDHHEDLVYDWLRILDRWLANNAASRIESMKR